MTKILQSTELTKSSYRFRSRGINPEWSVEKLTPVGIAVAEGCPAGAPAGAPFTRAREIRPCLIRNNASKIKPKIYISRMPKWLTVFEKEEIDTGTGEIVNSPYLSDDFKASRNRKIKTVEKFCNYYEPLYKRGEVSLLFHTFTRINYSKQDMRTMVECVKVRYRALKCEIRGFIWVLEVSERNHIHYHLIVAVDRVKFKRIPEELKMEDLWGQRTGVEFIKKSIKSYLTKYLYKSDAKLLSKRSYSISRKLI